MTHPFHPRTGETFGLVSYRRSWSHEGVDGLDAEGKLFSIALSWTDASAEDPFLVLSEGRASVTAITSDVLPKSSIPLSRLQNQIH